MYHPHLFFREIIIFKLEFPIPRRKALSEWCLKFTLFTKHFDSLYVMNFFMIIIIIIIVIMIFVNHCRVSYSCKWPMYAQTRG